MNNRLNYSKAVAGMRKQAWSLGETLQGPYGKAIGAVGGSLIGGGTGNVLARLLGLSRKARIGMTVGGAGIGGVGGWYGVNAYNKSNAPQSVPVTEEELEAARNGQPVNNTDAMRSVTTANSPTSNKLNILQQQDQERAKQEAEQKAYQDEVDAQLNAARKASIAAEDARLKRQEYATSDKERFLYEIRTANSILDNERTQSQAIIQKYHSDPAAMNSMLSTLKTATDAKLKAAGYSRNGANYLWTNHELGGHYEGPDAANDWYYDASYDDRMVDDAKGMK